MKVTANKKQMRFTIEETLLDGSKVKSRTLKLSKEEFEKCLRFTEYDWKYYLATNTISLC